MFLTATVLQLFSNPYINQWLRLFFFNNLPMSPDPLPHTFGFFSTLGPQIQIEPSDCLLTTRKYFDDNVFLLGVLIPKDELAEESKNIYSVILIFSL